MIRRWGILVAAPLLGLLAMVLPVLIKRPKHWYDAPLFPLVRNAVEHVGVWQIALLFLAGLVLGTVSRWRAMLLGGAVVLLLPLLAIAEIFADPKSHNLWPLEFVVYGFYGCVAAAGAGLVHRLNRRHGQSRVVRGA
jgi:hypothetical protein